MAEKKRASYTPEFRKKATDLALTSEHPTSYVAQLLKIKESTLGNWVAREKNKGKSGKQSAPNKAQKPVNNKMFFTDKASPLASNASLPLNEAPDLLDSSANHIPKVTTSPESNNKQNLALKTDELFQDISEDLPQELQRLRQENQRLKRECNIFREAIILLASQNDGLYG